MELLSTLLFCLIMISGRSKASPPTVNIKFVFEGEEESGSAHLGEILIPKDIGRVFW